MNKEALEKLILEGKSSYEMAEIYGKSQTTIRYWIKKLDLVLIPRAIFEDGKKFCYECKQFKEINEFYVTGGRSRNTCKSCYSLYVYSKQVEKKIKLIEYKGGKCEDCGVKYFGDNYVIFDFHHINPRDKDFGVKVVSKGIELLKREADKCKLLCSNCHRLEHRKLFLQI